MEAEASLILPAVPCTPPRGGGSGRDRERDNSASVPLGGLKVRGMEAEALLSILELAAARHA